MLRHSVFAPARRRSVVQCALRRLASTAPQPTSPVTEPSSHSPDLKYPGAATAEFTPSLDLWRASDRAPQSVFQTVSASGAAHGAVDVAEWRRLLQGMLRLRTLDDVFLAAQRQGRLSFYLASRGEEGAIIGATSGLHRDDVVFTQYREGAGVLLERGVSYSLFADQCVGNAAGHGRGRQMPIHYGASARHVQTVSSPLATQIPHAVGAARALRGTARTAAVFFGEGAASEGDFAGALALAATLRVPALFLCRNNGYAISTPAAQQYAGDGVAARAVAAGVPALRVDGADAAAVRAAIRRARECAMAESSPALVEIMTYRVADHSTSDDSARYRSAAEMSAFAQHHCPVDRARKVLADRGAWTEREEEAFVEGERALVLEALEAAEKKPMPPASDMFDDVYSESIPSIVSQQAQLAAYLDRNASKPVEKGT